MRSEKVQVLVFGQPVMPGGARAFRGRWQTSCDGRNRVTREAHVRVFEGLGVDPMGLLGTRWRGLDSRSAIVSLSSPDGRPRLIRASPHGRWQDMG